MNTLTFLFLIFPFFLFSQDIILKSGQVFRNAEIVVLNEFRVSIVHDSGAITVEWEDLQDDIREVYWGKEINLDFSIDTSPKDYVAFKVKSNLPENFLLNLSIQDINSSPVFRKDIKTDKKGEFIVKIDKTHFPQRVYSACLKFVAMSEQSQEVKALFGDNGEKLKGKIRHNVKSEWIEFFSTNHKFLTHDVVLCKLLDQLLSFKDDSNFHFYGFGIGGPYNKWLKSCETMRDYAHRNKYGASSVDLLQLGFEYMRKKGSESSYSRTILPIIKSEIFYDEYLMIKKQKKAIGE